MSADKENKIRWVATRKVDGEIEYLISHTTWGQDKRFAKVRRENLIVKQKQMNLTVIGF